MSAAGEYVPANIHAELARLEKKPVPAEARSAEIMQLLAEAVAQAAGNRQSHQRAMLQATTDAKTMRSAMEKVTSDLGREVEDHQKQVARHAVAGLKNKKPAPVPNFSKVMTALEADRDRIAEVAAEAEKRAAQYKAASAQLRAPWLDVMKRMLVAGAGNGASSVVQQLISESRSAVALQDQGDQAVAEIRGTETAAEKLLDRAQRMLSTSEKNRKGAERQSRKAQEDEAGLAVKTIADACRNIGRDLEECEKCGGTVSKLAAGKKIDKQVAKESEKYLDRMNAVLKKARGDLEPIKLMQARFFTVVATNYPGLVGSAKQSDQSIKAVSSEIARLEKLGQKCAATVKDLLRTAAAH